MNGEEQDLSEKKSELQSLGLQAIKDFFKVDPATLDKNILTAIHNKARIAMQFEREMNLTKRSVELNYLRVFRLVAEDKAELKKLIKKSLPGYLK